LGSLRHSTYSYCVFHRQTVRPYFPLLLDGRGGLNGLARDFSVVTSNPGLPTSGSKVIPQNDYRTPASRFVALLQLCRRVRPRRRDCQHFISKVPPTATSSLGVAYLGSDCTNLQPCCIGGYWGVKCGGSLGSGLAWPNATRKLATQVQRHEATDLRPEIIDIGSIAGSFSMVPHSDPDLGQHLGRGLNHERYIGSSGI
jgi:hypothetical protein